MTSDHVAARKHQTQAHYRSQQDAWQHACRGGLAAALIGCAGFWAILVTLFTYLIGA